MRGSTARQVTMLALVDSDQLIPADHPIGDVKPIVDDPLKELEPALPKGGTTEMLERLTRYLTAQPASRPGTDDFRAAVASEALATGHRRRSPASAAALDRHVPLSKHGPRRPQTMGVLIMRKLIATVFNYSLDGLLADEGTEFWKFCFDLPENREPDDPAQLDFLQSAYAHIMGRTAYEGIARSMTTTATDHPFADILNAARKVVFSRTLRTADWANTTVAAGDTAEEIDKLRRGGDGHIVVWGGVSLWRSLMRLDLIDEFHLSLFPYVSGEGTRLFDDVPKSYQLDLVSSTASSNGIIELHYRRHR